MGTNATTYPAAPVGENAAGERPSRWGWPLLAAGLVVLALGVLAAAEMYWIPQGIPREYVARSAVLVFPEAGAQPRPGWAGQVADRARSPGFLAAAVSKLGPKDLGTGMPLTPGELERRVHVNTHCVQVQGAAGAMQRGLLVVITVRGQDQQELEALARTWADALGASAGTADAPLQVTTPERVDVAYALCVED